MRSIAHRTWLPIALALALQGAAPDLSHAQPGGGPKPSEQAQTISIDFPGGTLEQYVEALKAAAPETVNIVIRGDASGFNVDPIQLRGVGLDASLRMLEGGYQSDPATNENVRLSIVSYPGDASGGEPIFVLVPQRAPWPPTGRASPQRDILVLSLKELTTSLPGDPPEVVVPAETVLTAVETALGVAGANDSETKVKFHAESGLLILAGSPEVLGAANSVVNSIRDDIRERRDRARDIQKIQGLTNPDALESELADARAEAEMAMVQTETARAQAAELQQALEERKTLAGAGNASAGEVRDLQARLRDVQAAAHIQQIKADRAAQRTAQAEQALARARAIAGGGGPDSEAQALREENAMLRDRLAEMEAQLTRLQDQLAALNKGKGGGAR